MKIYDVTMTATGPTRPPGEDHGVRPRHGKPRDLETAPVSGRVRATARARRTLGATPIVAILLAGVSATPVLAGIGAGNGEIGGSAPNTTSDPTVITSPP